MNYRQVIRRFHTRTGKTVLLRRRRSQNQRSSGGQCRSKMPIVTRGEKTVLSTYRKALRISKRARSQAAGGKVHEALIAARAVQKLDTSQLLMDSAVPSAGARIDACRGRGVCEMSLSPCSSRSPVP